MLTNYEKSYIIKSENARTHRKRRNKMSKFKVTFANENGKTKIVRVREYGIIPAIEKAITTNLDLLGWTITKAEEVK